MPIVVVARAVRHRALDVVRTDNAVGLHQAVDHLVALGHTRIAHIDGGRVLGAAERRRGPGQTAVIDPQVPIEGVCLADR